VNRKKDNPIKQDLSKKSESLSQAAQQFWQGKMPGTAPKLDNDLGQVVSSAERYQNRIDAARDIAENHIQSTQHYVLNNQATTMLQDFDINPTDFATLNGNALQQVLHDEFVSIINNLASIHQNYGHIAPIHQLNKLALQSLDIGRQYNQLGNTTTASTIADFCWAALHCVQDITIGIGEGIYQGVGNTLHMITHPIETIENMAHGAAHALGVLLYNAVEQTEIEWALKFDDLDAAESKINSANERFKRVDDAIREKLAELSLRDVSREITSFGTELYLQGKMLSTVGDFFTYAQEQIPKLAEAANLLQDERALLSTAEGMSVHIADEAISSAQAEQMLLQNMDQVAGGSQKVAANASKLIQTFELSNYHPSIGDLTKLEKAVELFEHTPGALTKDGPLYKALEFGKKAVESADLSTARGAMYEVEKAVQLAEMGEEIVEFGKKFNLNGVREFDIITKNKLIECKNIDWYKMKNIFKTQGKFGHQHKIAQKFGKIFEIHSKTPIPIEWKNWFIKQGIKFVEG